MYLNKAFLYGNLTRDPELKALPSGSQVANFGLATNRTYKDKSGAKQKQRSSTISSPSVAPPKLSHSTARRVVRFSLKDASRRVRGRGRKTARSSIAPR